MPTNGNNQTSMVGWVYFAGVVMILRGIAQAFLGITALVNHQYLLIKGQSTGQLVLTTANTTAWGWVDLAIGLIVLAAGFSLLHGSRWARVFAIVFVSLSFLENIAFLGIFPLWAIVALIIDVFVLYALIVQGREEV